MNGIHDLGGMHGLGPVKREDNELVFHAEWEKRVFAMALTAMGRRVCNVDEFRRAIEWMPPARYLAATYYEKWLHALESLLVEKGVATADEIAQGHAASPVDGGGAAEQNGGGESVQSFDNAAVKLRFDRRFKPGFKPGERVIARNLNPEHHTRLPRYARGKHGVIRHDQGVFIFPDTHAHGRGAKPQHVYTVEFEAKELWGPDANQRAPVYLDCWEDYLERDRAAARDGKAAQKSGKLRTATLKPKVRAAKPAAKRTALSRQTAARGRKK